MYTHIDTKKVKEVMNGKEQQVKGKFHEVEGKLTGNIGMQVKGEIEQKIGNAREKQEKARASV